MPTVYPITIVVDGPIVPDFPLSPVALVRADDLPDLVFTIQDDDGINVSLTGATAVFKTRLAGTTTTTNDANNTCVVSVPNSTCTYNLITTDFPRAGLYEGELILTITALDRTIYEMVYMTVRNPM